MTFQFKICTVDHSSHHLVFSNYFLWFWDFHCTIKVNKLCLIHSTLRLIVVVGRLYKCKTIAILHLQQQNGFETQFDTGGLSSRQFSNVPWIRSP